MAHFKLSAFADEVSSAFDEQLTYLHSRGISYIEPRNIDGTGVALLTLDEAKTAARKMKELDIGASAVGSPIGKITLDDDFSEHMRLFSHVLDIAEIFETKNIRMFSFFCAPDGSERIRAAVLARLELLCELAEKRGFTLCHENEKAIYGETPENCLDLMRHFDGRMKSVLDMGNFAFCKQDAYRGYELLAPYIEYIHIKDAFYDTRIVPAGKGEGKVAEILKDFDRFTDRDVFLTLEPHLTVFDGLQNLSNLDDITVENAYESPTAAFDAALEALRGILNAL